MALPRPPSIFDANFDAPRAAAPTDTFLEDWLSGVDAKAKRFFGKVPLEHEEADQRAAGITRLEAEFEDQARKLLGLEQLYAEAQQKHRDYVSYYGQRSSPVAKQMEEVLNIWGKIKRIHTDMLITVRDLVALDADHPLKDYDPSRRAYPALPSDQMRRVPNVLLNGRMMQDEFEAEQEAQAAEFEDYDSADPNELYGNDYVYYPDRGIVYQEPEPPAYQTYNQRN